MLRSALIAACLLALFVTTSSCSTPKPPQDFEVLAETQPCAASWNLRYERLVGDSCYRKRLTRAAQAGCKGVQDGESRDETACKVARMLERTGAASRSTPDEDELEHAISTGCDAGDADGCALIGREKLEEGDNVAEAIDLLVRGCKRGSAMGCFELHALYARGDVTLTPQQTAGFAQSAAQQCEQGVVPACRLEETLAADEAAHSAADQPEGTDKACGDDAKCHQDACRRGQASACTRFASLLEQEDGPSRALGRAFGAYERACAMGDWAGCGELGRFYEQGRVVPRSYTIARQLFEWACTPDHPSACVSAGRMFAEGLGGSRDVGAAQAMFTGACDAGDATGCRKAADVVANDNTDRAEGLFSKACDLGDGPSCVRLAHLRLSDRTGKEHTQVQSSDENMRRDKRIAELFHRACDAGYGAGCEEGADRFQSGDGVSEDDKIAAELAAKACQTGSPSHCWGAADAFRFGYGVDTDHPRAEKLIESAIEGYRDDCQKNREYSRACMNAAHALAHGYPKKKRLEEARAFLNGACEEGAADACREIAFQKVAGEIFAVDRDSGIATMVELCDKGDALVCQRLAVELTYGAQTEAELGRASRLLNRACYWRSESRACAMYASQFVRGHGQQKSLEDAYRHASSACTGDDALGCPVATQAALRGDPSDTEDDLLDTVEKLCVYEGHNVACTPLARMYESGFNTKRDTYRALSLYQRVCDAGEFDSPEACARAKLVKLSHKLADDEQPSDGDQKALEKACKGGDSARCVLLARNQEFGLFDADRFETAGKSYRRACAHGNADACTLYVATGHEEGTLWGPKFREELEWACERGNADMCSKWGRLMGSHNWELAVRLNQQACQKGLDEACRFLQANLEAREAVVEGPDVE
jgi:TPR repeat protein